MPECPICKQEFKPTRTRKKQTYCGTECRDESLRRYTEFVCKVCKNPCKKLAKLSHVYCSVECSNQDRRKDIEKEDLISTMLKHRYGAWPNWSNISKALRCSHHTAKALAIKFELVDKKLKGPIINGEYLPIPKSEPRKINLELTSKEYLENKLIENRRIEGDCWIWTGTSDKRGYAYTHLPRPYDRECLVKVVALYVWKDRPFQFNRFVYHKCRNKKCFNPDHLIVCRDRSSLGCVLSKHKSTKLVGDSNGRAKIDLGTALDIRDGIKYGETNKQISARLNVNVRLVYYIRRRKTWKHIWQLRDEYTTIGESIE